MTDIGKALINPASVFRAPRDVLTAEALSLEQKIEILRRWEYDARELQVAEEENMPGDDNGLFDEILLALHELGAGIDTTHSPPTKHGGV